MTVKVYKKRTRWYFKYRTIEYQLPDSQSINFFATLYDSNIIYFKIHPYAFPYGLGLVPTWEDTHTFTVSRIIKDLIKTVNKFYYDNEIFKFKFDLGSIDYGVPCLNIVDIWTNDSKSL